MNTAGFQNVTGYNGQCVRDMRKLINKQLYILPKISRSEGKETMKFGQLTEYNKINIFL